MQHPDEQHAKRDIFNIGEVQGNVVVQNRELSARSRNEQILLKTDPQLDVCRT